MLTEEEKELLQKIKDKVEQYELDLKERKENGLELPLARTHLNQFIF